MTNNVAVKLSNLDINKYIERSIPADEDSEGYHLFLDNDNQNEKLMVQITEHFWDLLDTKSSFSIYPSAIALEVKNIVKYKYKCIAIEAKHKDTGSILFLQELSVYAFSKFEKAHKENCQKMEAKSSQTNTTHENINEKENILKELSTFIPEGNILKVPKFQLENYAKIKKILMTAGAEQLLNDFVFDEDVIAKNIQEDLISGKIIDDKKKFQFFETTEKLVNKMMNKLNIKQHEKWLEPSAGQGAIADKMFSFSKYGTLVELMPKNVKVLKEKQYEPVEIDFLMFSSEMAKHKFDKIGANPPFTKNQDIKHIKHMYEEHLSDGGTLSSYASQFWVKGEQKEQKEFRSWLLSFNADVEYIDEGEFKESGTTIATTLITIKK